MNRLAKQSINQIRLTVLAAHLQLVNQISDDATIAKVTRRPVGPAAGTLRVDVHARGDAFPTVRMLTADELGRRPLDVMTDAADQLLRDGIHEKVQIKARHHRN